MNRNGWTFLAVVAVAAAAWAAPAGKERPAAFPKVDLTPGSAPYFVPVYVDVDTNEIAYVLFDGNVSNGYSRMYFWIPGHSEFRTPKAYRYNMETRRFGPVTFQPRHAQDDVRLSWSFNWGRHGGAFEHFNYLTGQTVKGTRPVYAHFTFHCDYLRRPRGGSRPADSLVDITINGDLRASLWTNMPVALQPWNTLNYYKSMQLVRDKNDTQVLFRGRLNYGNSGCEVRSLPRETVCTLVVSPYMHAPVYTNDVTWVEAFQQGVQVRLDYGWYDLYWNISCPGLNVRPRLDVAVRASPYPVTRIGD